MTTPFSPLMLQRLEQVRDVQVGFSSSDGFIGRAIEWFTRGGPSHVIMPFQLPDRSSRDVFEATWPKIIIRPFVPGETNSGLYRPPPGVDMDSALKVVARACLADHYDLGGLVGMIPVEMLRRVAVYIANPVQSKHQEFCSCLADMTMRVARWPGTERLDPHSTDPGQLRKVCEACHG